MTTPTSFFCAFFVLIGGLWISTQRCRAEPPSNGSRIWTSKEGVTIEGALEEIDDDKVVLKDTGGNEFRVSPQDLSEDDQAFIETWRKEMAEFEQNFQAPGKRKQPEERKLRQARIAMDISSNCFKSTFGGSMKKVDAAVERIIRELNRVWVPEVGIQFEIGNLEVRTDRDSDPYQETRDPGAQLGIGRDLNGKHRCDVVFILCADADHGGGLGGGRGVWVAWGGDAWDLMHHEFSHAFGTSHGHGWPFELGTMNQVSQGSRYPRERRHMFNYMEVQIIREHTKDLKEIGFAEEKVPPYAMFDEIRIKRPRSSSRLGDQDSLELFLDPLANDYDTNGGEVSLDGVDRKSARGAKLTTLSDGRIRYRLDGGFPNYLDYDFLHYTISDEDGLESRGGIVLFFEKAENLVTNGDFSRNKVAWDWTNASVIENGEAPTSVTIDQRALLQPGGEISQEVKLDGFLTKKYVLEATLYCGPEKDSSGQSVDPAEDPMVVIGLYGEGRKLVRRVSEKDVTMEMPIQLRRSHGTFELRFTNEGEVPVRIGHVVLRPVD